MSSKYKYPSPYKELGLKARRATGNAKIKHKKVVVNLPTTKDEDALKRKGHKVCPNCGGLGYTYSRTVRCGTRKVKSCIDSKWHTLGEVL